MPSADARSTTSGGGAPRAPGEVAGAPLVTHRQVGRFGAGAPDAAAASGWPGATCPDRHLVGVALAFACAICFSTGLFAQSLSAISYLPSAVSVDALATRTQDSALPGGRGSEIVLAKCVTCHQADLIRQQRLTRAGWGRELDKMIRWSATVTEGERDVVLDYLTANFGPRPSEASPATSTERRSEVLKSRCLVCHQADIIEQQRLDRAAWTREVEKMMRWGAGVTDTEKDLLVEYLASRYGPRPSSK